MNQSSQVFIQAAVARPLSRCSRLLKGADRRFDQVKEVPTKPMSCRFALVMKV